VVQTFWRNVLPPSLIKVNCVGKMASYIEVGRNKSGQSGQGMGDRPDEPVGIVGYERGQLHQDMRKEE
jgi:hypothetical protein